MPENDNITTKDSYTILIEKLDAMEAKYASLEEKYEEVCSFNRALLDRDSTSTNTTDDAKAKAEAKFAAMLKGE